MSFIPVPSCVEVVFVFDIAGREQRVVINITGAVAWTIALMQALASDIVDVIVADALPWISYDYSITKLHVTDLSSDTAPSFDWVTGSGTNALPVVGGNANAASPMQSALVTTLRTLSRGRSFRGRNYWPGLATNAFLAADGRTVSATRVTDQQTFVNSVITAVASVPGQNVVVVSRHANKIPRTTGIHTLVTSHDTNNVVDTQRRRIEH